MSIALLERGVAESVALNDSDPLIAALWGAVFGGEHEWLIEQISTVPLNIDEWKRQKGLVPQTMREKALKALYLNRTSFNGILHKAGPIGGWGQTKRTLDVRFNRKRLAARVRELASLGPRIRGVHCMDWQAFCAAYEGEGEALFYFDPPYYHKAEQLYGHYFNEDQHIRFRDFLMDFRPAWVLSYDDAKEVRELYRDRQLAARVIDSTYSAHPMGGASFVGRELFFSNMEKLPVPDALDATHRGLSVKKYVKDEAGALTRVPFTNLTTS